MRPVWILIGLTLGFQLTLMGQTNEDRRRNIEKREAATPSPEALDRKAHSIARLKSEGVPTVDHLPVIEDSKQAKIRTKEEIAHRTIAVCLTAVKGEGVDQKTVDLLVKHFGAEKFFSPKEAAFIKNPHPTQKELAKFSWRYECYWVLLWSLGYIDKLARPEQMCDVPKATGILRDLSTEQFIEHAKLRPIGEILDQADLLYRYDWAAVNARLKNQSAPAKLESGVVQEWHYVLNWLIGYMDQQWDDISTDT